MKRLLPLIAALMVLVSCHDELELPTTPWKHVVVVYMMAENSLSTFAQRDLNEMRQGVTDIPDSCKLVVYFDNSRTDQNPQILVLERKGESVLYDYRNDPVSTDSTTLRGALATILKAYPAEHYGLVMWSHGSGWIPAEPRRTIGIDNGRNSLSNVGREMEITTLANVLRQTGQRWDYVFFDACFMQGVEVAYELRDVTRWCIGSPAEIPADGAPYDVIMPDLFLGEEEVWRIAEDYYDYYKENGGLVISALRTDGLEELAAATAPLVATLPDAPSTEGVQQYFASAEHGFWKPEYFDMGSAMHHWFAGEAYEAWREVLDRTVPHQYVSPQWKTAYSTYFDPTVTDPEHVATVSVYVPSEGRELNEYYRRTAWGKRMRND